MLAIKLIQILATFGLVTIAVPSAAAFQAELTKTVEHFYKQSDTPALGVIIVHKDEIIAQSIQGFRVAGGHTKVTANDRWHIGSMTKAFTAYLIYKLAEDGVLKLDIPIQNYLNANSPIQNERLENITLNDLLSHQSGLVKNLPRKFWKSVFAERTRADGRKKYVNHILSVQGHDHGTFRYSNAGYVVAGHVAEVVTQRSWENLIKIYILDQLKIREFGVGAPLIRVFDKSPRGARIRAGTNLNQPRGHQRKNGKFVPVSLNTRGDNPLVMASAGGLNMSLVEISKFLIDSLNGIRGEGGILRPESYREIHQPRDTVGDYGAGWVIRNGIHFHNGTNLY